MKFADVITPGKERVRAFRDCRVGTHALKKNEAAEALEADARAAVARGDVTYATRVKLLKPIGPFGQERVEPGVGSVLEVASSVARQMEKEGTGEPAPPLKDGPSLPLDRSDVVRIKVASPKKSALMVDNRHQEKGVFIGFIGRTCAPGEVHDVPRDAAERYVASGIAVVAEGEKLTKAG